jgi:hypothetical protein
MMKAILLVTLVALACGSLTRNHDFWYTAAKAVAKTGLPFADTNWGYCDMKCTYLERYYPGNDFVVIPFSESTLKPDFAACYIAKTGVNGTSYALWNTVATNSYFEVNCGGGKDQKESEDYYQLTQGANPKYKVSGPILGQGIGTEIDY